MWVSYISLEATAHRLTEKKKKTRIKKIICTQNRIFIHEISPERHGGTRSTEAGRSRWEKGAGQNGCMVPTHSPWGSLKSTGKCSHLDLFLRGGSHQDSTVQGRPLSHQKRSSVPSYTCEWLWDHSQSTQPMPDSAEDYIGSKELSIELNHHEQWYLCLNW